MAGQEYVCDGKYPHAQYDPKGNLKRCQGYIHGQPCKGRLKKVGEGSRKKEQG